jgi:hypothetical protein
MKKLGYIFDTCEDMILVRSSDKNLPLYHLAFFSKNTRGIDFLRKARKSASAQKDLFR